MRIFRRFKLFQCDFIEIRQKHKIAGSMLLFFALLGINCSLSQLAVNMFGLAESYFVNFTPQLILPVALTVASYPKGE